MRVECTGTAIIADKNTLAEFKFQADELEWEHIGITFRSMGAEHQYSASIGHETLGLLMWDIWEYPTGIQNMKETDVNGHKLFQDFTYNLVHENETDFEYQIYDESDESEGDITSLNREERIEKMAEWFFFMFEDPQNQTPYAMDKESPHNYEYIWGGPYDASEQISENFAQVAADGEIEAAVEIVQNRDGTLEWAPSDNHPDMRRRDDDARSEREGEFPSLDFLRQKISEGVKPTFGSDDELEAKSQLLAVMEDLRPLIARLNRPAKHGGMGHNHPPEDTALPANISVVITDNITILQNELISEIPDVDKIAEATGVFQTVKSEIIDFLTLTKNQIKSQGSKALAAAILSGVGYISWLAIKWLTAAMVGLPTLF